MTESVPGLLFACLSWLLLLWIISVLLDIRRELKQGVQRLDDIAALLLEIGQKHDELLTVLQRGMEDE